ncbi:recombination protein O N-terminal domain-containing protein [Candidatus Kaiserbacteria bacterium]|nr:recombination protein O N-terminal domain-containing protein [Candidatus Kaiserbacteria bacterium]
MYPKYQTDALVLGGKDVGEADRSIVLYTEDFGLIRARVSAIRKENSKMRYALQNFSRCRVGLIRGARGWRAVGAMTLTSFHAATESGVKAYARLARLVVRLIGGEEKNDYLFEVLVEAHRALTAPLCASWRTIELISVARILYALGYLSPEALEAALFTHTAYTGDSLEQAEVLRPALLSKVNRAIGETHL